MPDDGATPLLIDCNPRLVEPMSAYLAGADLVGLLLRISQGETPAALPESREGVRTHLAMQALLGCASRGGTRRDIIAGMLAFADGRWTICGQRRGVDAGAARLAQRRAAGDDRDTSLLVGSRRWAVTSGEGRLGRASARSRKHPADRERGFPLAAALQRLIVVAVAVALRRGDVAILDILVLDRCRRRLSSTCRRPCLGGSLFLPVPPMMFPLIGCIERLA